MVGPTRDIDSQAPTFWNRLMKVWISLWVRPFSFVEIVYNMY